LSPHQVDELASTGQLAAAIVRRAERDQEAARRRVRDRIEHLLAHPADLETVFQPIVSVDRWRVVGYEALARFRVGPTRSPGAWFADAVEVGLSADLQALAVRRARQAAARAGLPAGIFLSVNVRPQDLAHPLVTRALGSGSLERLVIEVTEDEPIGDYPAMRAAMRPYLARGARFAVDDAGAGFASMRHVTELHPAFVKLDAHLVRGLGDDEARQALVRAIVGFAAEIGAESVAEGVEQPADLALLARTGLPILAQGFAIARPGPAWPTVDLAAIATRPRPDPARSERPSPRRTRASPHPHPPSPSATGIAG
jgi:EAL domain-containing protein (putative c-di-GMP-specific phosphodiesterase class I)